MAERNQGSGPDLRTDSSCGTVDSRTRARFSVIFLATTACNCSCTYCFENLDRRSIPDERWEKLFAGMRGLAEKTGCAELHIFWQGGEILTLSPETVRRALRLVEEEFRGTGIKLLHQMQTNLLLYETSKWRDIIAEHFGGGVGSSLDYPNLYRRTATLHGEAYNEAWCAKRRMAERDGLRVSVISLPNRGSLEIGPEQFYRYYRDEVAVDGLQINLPFPNEEKGFEPMPLEDLGRFLAGLYGHWVDSGREIGLSPFQAFEERMLLSGGNLPCLWAHRCSSSMLCIGPDGMVAQCDCWATTFREYGFGSVLEEDPAALLASDARQAFARRPVRLQRDSACGECPYWSLCFGGCAVRAFTWTGDFDAPDHYCPVYRDVFDAIADRTRTRGFSRIHSNNTGGGDARQGRTPGPA